MYEINIENRRDHTYKVYSDGREFVIDSDVKGIGPLPTLLSGLGACVGVYLNRYLDGTKLGITGFKVNVKGELSKEQPLRFKEIFVDIKLEGQSLDDARKEGILRFAKNCPVHNTLTGNPEIKFILE